MNIYHCFAFGLTNRVCEVLRQRISKRYSKRHFLYVCQSHPCTKQTARHGISKSKYIHYFLIIQNLSQLIFMFHNIKNSVSLCYIFVFHPYPYVPKWNMYFFYLILPKNIYFSKHYSKHHFLICLPIPHLR